MSEVAVARPVTHDHHVNPWLATQDTLTGLGGEPTPSDQAQALVDGFHVAYLGSAVLVGVAFFALLFLLRRQDVVAAGEGELAASSAT